MTTTNHNPGLYDTIHRRRDVRAEFTGGEIGTEELERVLAAAHAAPSVGMSQPWDFVLIRDRMTKEAFLAHVQLERERFAASLPPDRLKVFETIKIEGILESSLSVVVTYDAGRGSPGVLGRHSIADAGLYSVCLAIQNMWLAATAEGWGMGWVSFYEELFLSDLLGIPEGIRPVAWLCLGPVAALQAVPDLERFGWRERRSLDEAIHRDRW
ncbi:MAG: 5,6-dimethylbenzimidazole synthase [Acidimicrobiales bacterium]